MGQHNRYWKPGVEASKSGILVVTACLHPIPEARSCISSRIEGPISTVEFLGSSKWLSFCEQTWLLFGDGSHTTR